MTAETATRPVATGALIDEYWAVREEKRRLEADIKEAETRIEAIEKALMEKMDKEGIDKATGRKATASITTNVVADVQDWDALWPYIAKNKLWHLVQKRVSDPAYRELLELGKKVPGVAPFAKRKLNLRSL